MFVNKYNPKTLNDIIGHTEQINKIGHWLKEWNSSNNYPEIRGILISGPSGIGKTSSVYVIAKTLGYKINEYNASDIRTISAIRNIIDLNTNKLVKEIIIMDEIDGLIEKGGIGELASILKKTCIPIICISNEKPPKLRQLLNVCMDVKFNRPMKTTIATALLKIAKQENIKITKQELEELCEKNGNDIRSILNILEFYGSKSKINKDELVRLDVFSATQSLFNNKNSSIDTANNLVFLDHILIPLMIQEGYVLANNITLDDIVKASEYISEGDIVNTYIHTKNNWNLLSHMTQSYVGAVKSIKGSAPFQTFPQWLGKKSKHNKHKRYINVISTKKGCSNNEFRLDYADTIQTILLKPLQENSSNIKPIIKRMDEIQITRNDINNLQEIVYDSVELSTKIKSSFTREYNKVHTDIKKLKNNISSDDEDISDEDCNQNDPFIINIS